METRSGLKFRDIFVRALGVLSPKEKRHYALSSLFQICLTFFDLIGVVLIGLLGAITARGLQSLEPGNRAAELLKILNLSNLTLQQQTIILATGAAVAFVLKSILSISSSKKILHFVSARTNSLSNELIQKLFSRQLSNINSMTSQQLFFAITEGVTSLTIRILGGALLLVADLSVLILLGVGLFLADPIVALSAFLGFSMVGFLLFISTQRRGYQLGKQLTRHAIESNEKTNQTLDSFREIFVKNQLSHFVTGIVESRAQISYISADLFFIPIKAKYVMETSLVFFALILCGIQFYINDFGHAIATLSIFLIAGTRIAPAILRIQQTMIQIKVSTPSALTALGLIEEFKAVESIVVLDKNVSLQTRHEGFEGVIEVESVDFNFEGNSEFKISEINLHIKSGQFVALVGPTGSGKTTLVDLILGINHPQSGKIRISNLNPRDTFQKWPGAVAYVPQEVTIFNGTIRSNLVFGYANDLVTDEQIWDALKKARLSEFVNSLGEGLNHQVVEHGNNLSGGQKQRLGIARALLSNPALLILDEATSSLDAKTELELNQSIQFIKGNTTIIMIAHRLSTVQEADVILYMENGKIVEKGNFEEMKIKVPDFATQSRLMGL